MKTDFELTINNTLVVGTCEYTTRNCDESFDHAFGTEKCYSQAVDYIDDIDAYTYVGDGDEVPYTGNMEELEAILIDYINERL